MTFKHLKGCNKWPLHLKAALKPGHFLAWPQEPRPGAACSLGMCLKTIDFLATFSFVDFTSFTAKQESQRNTQMHTRHQARHSFDSTPWTWAAVAKPSLCLADTGGRSCRCTQRITWLHEHLYIHRSHKYQHDPSACLETPQRFQTLLLAPGVPSSLPGPAWCLLANMQYWHACPAWTPNPTLDPEPPSCWLVWMEAGEWPVLTPEMEKLKTGVTTLSQHLSHGSLQALALSPSLASLMQVPPASCFLGHTPFPPQWAAAEEPPSSWHGYLSLSRSWYQARVTCTPSLAPAAGTQPFKPSHMQDREIALI